MKCVFIFDLFFSLVRYHITVTSSIHLIRRIAVEKTPKISFIDIIIDIVYKKIFSFKLQWHLLKVFLQVGLWNFISPIGDWRHINRNVFFFSWMNENLPQTSSHPSTRLGYFISLIRLIDRRPILNSVFLYLFWTFSTWRSFQRICFVFVLKSPKLFRLNSLKYTLIFGKF